MIDWVGLIGNLSHNKHSFHQTHQIKAEELLKQMSIVELNITSLLDDHHMWQIEENCKGIEGIHAIIYLGHQGQTLRGHTELQNYRLFWINCHLKLVQVSQVMETSVN